MSRGINLTSDERALIRIARPLVETWNERITAAVLLVERGNDRVVISRYCRVVRRDTNSFGDPLAEILVGLPAGARRWIAAAGTRRKIDRILEAAARCAAVHEAWTVMKGRVEPITETTAMLVSAEANDEEVEQTAEEIEEVRNLLRLAEGAQVCRCGHTRNEHAADDRARCIVTWRGSSPEVCQCQFFEARPGLRPAEATSGLGERVAPTRQRGIPLGASSGTDGESYDRQQERERRIVRCPVRSPITGSFCVLPRGHHGSCVASSGTTF